MRRILASLLLLCAISAQAQGPQQLIDIPYDFWSGATVKAWLYLPADYATSTKKYPVVFFYHGVGEAGTNPYTVLNVGLPNLISNGMRPDNIVNPADGQPYSFIVVSPQHWSWSPSPLWLPYHIDWMKLNYRIDTNRIYVTGLSAGGQQSYGSAAMHDHVSKLIAAAVPMSPATVSPYNPSLVGQYKIKTWFFAGNSDGGYTQNAIGYNNDCNSQLPNSSRLNLYQGGHCCWNSYYDIAWKDPVANQSIYEWMLLQTRQQNTILPVKFTGVVVRKQKQGGVLVNWQVADERDVSIYEVEKSRDGNVFFKLESVAAGGRTSYNFTDTRVDAKAFYRVRSVDFNGSFKYSNVVAFSGDITTLLMAFPSPAQTYTLLSHPKTSSSAQLLVFSGDGRLVRQLNLMEGTYQTRLDLDGLTKGLYVLSFTDGDTKESIRFIKE